MGFPILPKETYTFDWKELDGKILKIAVAEPNPEVLEMYGQVFGFDPETNTHYLLHEWIYKEKE